MKRKIIALALAAVLLFSALPVVSAEEAQSYQEKMVSTALSYEGATSETFEDVSFDWCAYFVTYVAHELGLCGTVSDPASGLFPPIEKSTWSNCNWATTSVAGEINWMTGHGTGTLYYFLTSRSINLNSNTVNADRSDFIPVPGDLIYFNTEEHGSYCHVAIVSDFDPESGAVYYIGGNQDDLSWSKSCVSCRCDNIYTDKICGFMRPNYSTEYSAFPSVSEHICPSADFTDVTETSWFHEELDYVMNRGLIKGTSETTFSPNATMTRGMMITVLYRLDGSPDMTEAEIPFNDISDDTWCADAVKWAYSTGVSDGYGDGTFRTNVKITRAQAAKMLYGFALYKELDTSAYADFESFADAGALGTWAYPSMHWALGSGILKGTSSTTISPNGSATRCQFVVILARYLNYYEL